MLRNISESSPWWLKVEWLKDMLVPIKVLFETKIKYDSWYYPGHTSPQTPNAVCGKFTHVKPNTWMHGTDRKRWTDRCSVKSTSVLMFQWSRDETLKIVAKTIAQPYDLSSHQILICAAKLFFSWQTGTGCSHSFQKHLQSSRLNLSLGANRHHKLILDMSVTVHVALGFTQNLCITIFCWPALHTTHSSQYNSWHNILWNVLQISISEILRKIIYICNVLRYFAADMSFLSMMGCLFNPFTNQSLSTD